ncbi:LacI family DNA-binding transcriptional regulator [Aggregatilinea lenta]|uniref:LacI family DNA-binding transcriptional regulator n=1 Tax=Aggregatilinea lenta TaxID=913108 RepID=UPI0013C308A5|nr:LacI family DNA-binding transcriptional regulator [Aggregatilinea lenta]
MATVRDVAQRAHVSIATVSRALNNHPRVSESTRMAVIRAAQDLGYPVERLRSTPHIAQSVLVLARHDSEGAAGPAAKPIVREFEQTVWRGVHAVLEERGITTRLQSSHISSADADFFANDMGVSGLVLLGGMIHPRFVAHLQARAIPFVVAGAHLHPLRVNCVMADVPQGMRDATQHLIDTGRRRIGLVNGPDETTTSREKWDTLRLMLALNDLPFDPRQVTISGFNAEAGCQQTYRLLDQFPELDAIVYADATIAMGGLRALREKGRRIPEDVAVVGFGDYEIAEFTDPPLTTVHFDMHQMGAIAARRLCMLLDDAPDEPWLIRVPTTLKHRKST